MRRAAQDDRLTRAGALGGELRAQGLEARGCAEPVAPTFEVALDIHGAGAAPRVEIILRRDVQESVALANRVPIGLAIERAKARAACGCGEKDEGEDALHPRDIDYGRFEYTSPSQKRGSKAFGDYRGMR